MKTHDIAPDELQLDQIFQGGVIRFVLLDQVNATVTGHEHQQVTVAGILSVIFARQLLDLTRSAMQFLSIRRPVTTQRSSCSSSTSMRQTASYRAKMLQLVGSTPIVADCRPPLEVSPFLEHFLADWQNYSGVCEMKSGFVRAPGILVSILREFTSVSLK